MWRTGCVSTQAADCERGRADTGPRMVSGLWPRVVFGWGHVFAWVLLVAAARESRGVHVLRYSVFHSADAATRFYQIPCLGLIPI
jgi:hypothetical protein